jgi:hypothetical protein
MYCVVTDGAGTCVSSSKVSSISDYGTSLVSLNSTISGSQCFAYYGESSSSDSSSVTINTGALIGIIVGAIVFVIIVIVLIVICVRKCR